MTRIRVSKKLYKILEKNGVSMKSYEKTNVFSSVKELADKKVNMFKYLVFKEINDGVVNYTFVFPREIYKIIELYDYEKVCNKKHRIMKFMFRKVRFADIEIKYEFSHMIVRLKEFLKFDSIEDIKSYFISFGTSNYFVFDKDKKNTIYRILRFNDQYEVCNAEVYHWGLM